MEDYFCNFKYKIYTEMCTTFSVQLDGFSQGKHTHVTSSQMKKRHYQGPQSPLVPSLPGSILLHKGSHYPDLKHQIFCLFLNFIYRAWPLAVAGCWLLLLSVMLTV